MTHPSMLRALGFSLLLGGCATTVPDKPVPSRPTTPVVARPPATFSTTGLETIVGRTARMIEGQFGRPDLDIREGTARKLQFTGPACILDAYLYPPRAGGEPIVTHVDARLPDGRDMDRASCVAALTRRPEAR